MIYRVCTAIVLLVSLSLVLSHIHATGQTPSSSVKSGASKFECLDSSNVKVRVLSKPLPAGNPELYASLWENFINSDIVERYRCPVSRWREQWNNFSEALVKNAEIDALESESLKACLAQVLKDAGEYAYLPIGASYGELEGRPVWVILVNWEWADSSPREVLGHTRVYVLDAKDAQQVGFATCG